MAAAPTPPSPSRRRQGCLSSGTRPVAGRRAAACALGGETERATTELAEARRLSSEGSYSSVARLRATTRYEAQAIRALCEATYFAGLRKAGMPEE
jgi:hypothetical protein